MGDDGPRVRTYLLVYVLLLGLLGATTGLAFLDLGGAGAAAALLIAAMKALLVLLFFMHLRGSPRLVWLFAGVGFYWLAILVSLSLSDLLTRPWFSSVLGSRP
ncbi:MAG TPA: cytochrome C oxidase subunit IV family protein [Planctomycetota bacterium]|nr:cytochrome C oxidase subunit IV family protein [Planctomycetota bacterium]